MLPTKILIANRSEIAIRVMRTCEELGIATVAVYSDLDRDALHTSRADEAYALGGQTAAESYLDTNAILDVIKRSGADGVHPGYGFFSENADFARAVDAAGVTWIGPPPEAIEVMGDKISSRKAAAEAKVSGVPGTMEPVTDAATIVAFGKQHGYPIAIKAAYGGGGKGLKVVHDSESVPAAMESAMREAEAYFGRSEIYMERYLDKSRHIEIQVFCDTHGNAVWLGDRDCSAQRRHQKLIEETPAPGLTDKTRTAMGEAAVKVARKCGYVGAGTVEFLYQDGDFYFLEMNTRLQVEHCVTEMVTGIDLVAEQIRVASGEPLSFTQDSVVRRGHAMECRINAEDPSRDFMPSPGKITRFHRPDGFGVRVDAGYDAGHEVSQYYDNLIAKLITWGPDRESARRRMLRALREFQISGIHTTIPAHLVLLSEPAFIEARHSTKWVESELDPSVFAAAATDVAAGSPPMAGAPEALIERAVPVEVNGKLFNVKVWLPETPSGGGAGSPAGGMASGASAASRPTRARPAKASASATVGPGDVTAPMQGTIVKVLVAVGDKVESGQAILVLEAMKMENHISAEGAGIVKEIRVSEGDTVGSGDVLVVLE